MELEQPHAEFQSTRWSLIARLRNGDREGRENALSILAEIYWPAVYGFLRRKGLGREAAADTTQAFFADVVMGRSLFDGASPGGGRLRSLLLTALRNYTVDQARRSEARGKSIIVRLDPSRLERHEESLGRDGAMSQHAESAFDRQWAATQVEESVRRCREYFEKCGKVRHWTLFEERVIAPSVWFTSPPPLVEAAARLGWSSAADAAAAVQTVKKRFDIILREVVSETTSGDAEDEYAQVLRQLA